MQYFTLSLPRTLIISFVVLLAWFFVSPVHAQNVTQGLELDGYAWSSNIGWISLNCRSGSATGQNICGQSSYRITIGHEGANRGHLSGYAWSPNVGWISFNGSMNGTTPSGGGTTSGTARLADPNAYSNTRIIGWARVCSAMTSNCANTTETGVNSSAGGWDGWISFNGTNYGVNTQNFGTAQYVWGGSVLGWIDFSTHVRFAGGTSQFSGTGCTITTAGANSCNGSLTWNLAPSVTTPRIVRTVPATPPLVFNNRAQVNQTVSLTLGTPQSFQARDNATAIASLPSVTLTAQCGSGLTPVSGTCQPPPPAVPTINSLTATPTIVRRGQTAQLAWNLSSSPTTGLCTITGGGISHAVTTQTGQVTTASLSATSRITLTCGSGPTAQTRSVIITVVPTFNEI